MHLIVLTHHGMQTKEFEKSKMEKTQSQWPQYAIAVTLSEPVSLNTVC